MSNQKVKNSDDLPSGFILFCSNCGHSLMVHLEGRLADNSEDSSIESICKYDNGHYVCPCQGFETQEL